MGRIEKLFVNYVGSTVKKGDPLVSIYSPDLLVAQEELLTAVRGLNQQKGAGELALSPLPKAWSKPPKRKLQLWGITAEQVDEIIKRGTAADGSDHLLAHVGHRDRKSRARGDYVEQGKNLYTIADLSRVWMQVKIFEDQIAGINPGTAVQVTSAAHPDEVFAGKITFIAYTVDPATRTVSARVEIDNAEYKLKPGMYAMVVIRTPVGSVTGLGPESGSAEMSAAMRHGETGTAVMREGYGQCTGHERCVGSG